MAIGLRERARRELVEEIIETARSQLATQGAADLSVRAVTRQLGMSASAVYRYFPNRDALLTALIVSAYQRLGDAARDAEARVDSADYAGRWLAVFRAVRSWALAHRHEYALIYGSPVPGYHAPEDTVVPASGVALRLAAIAIDADRAVGLAPQAPLPPSEDLRRDAAERAAQALAALGTERAGGLDEIDPSAVIAVIDGWTQLFGTVSFELFGHYERTVEAREDYLDHVATTSGRTVGIPGL